MTTMSTMHGRTEATHRFLKLIMPIASTDLPRDKVLQKGQTYKLPFTFVVPGHLLPRSCMHKCANSMVKETHLQLPPSMGDPDLSGFGPHLLDDMAPEMVKISYSIRVRISKKRDDGADKLIDQEEKKLRIKPAFDELPPITIDLKNEEYCLQQEKTLKKGMLKGKLGRLTIEAAQPKSFRLPCRATTKDEPPISTMAKMKLRFEPHDVQSCKPPKLGMLTSRLKVTSFFSSSPRVDFPTRSTSLTNMSQGYITETLPLSTRNVNVVEWTKHESRPANMARRDSAQGAARRTNSGSSSESEEDTFISDKPYYTASILVPLSLPLTKNFIPTFHSCIASRTYTLALGLSISSKALLSSDLTLKVPIQISSEGSAGYDERRRQADADAVYLATQEVDEMFRPRNTTMNPSEQPSADAPPMYGGVEFHGGATPGIEREEHPRIIAEFARRESQPIFSQSSDIIQSAGMDGMAFMGGHSGAL